MKKILLIIVATCIISACSDNNGAIKALKEQGYTNIQITGYKWFGCGSGDNFSTGFEATSATGIPVNGVVCSGWFKGATIRTF